MPNPWEIEAETWDKFYPGEGLDIVVVDWLKAGDTRPLAWALTTGKPLAPYVMLYLGLMLHPDGGMSDDETGEELVPYRLEAFARSGKQGNARKPENFSRDLMAATVVKKLMEEGATYEKARASVADAWGLGPDTVRNAYRRWYGRGKQTAD